MSAPGLLKRKVNMTKTRIPEIPNIPDLVRESVELVSESIGDMIEANELPVDSMEQEFLALCKLSHGEIREQYLKANTMIFKGILLLASSRGAAICKRGDKNEKENYEK